MKRLLAIVFALLSVLIFTLACAQSSPYKIGLLLPFTGAYDWVGANVQPVAQMIADTVNSSGGIGGHDLTLLQADTQGEVDAGFTAAQKLINADSVLALIGPTSLSINGSKQLIIDQGMPMVSPTVGSTVLDKANKTYFFRTVPSDSLGGRAIARAATDAKYLGRDTAFKSPVLMVGNAPLLRSPYRTALPAMAHRLRRPSSTHRKSRRTAVKRKRRWRRGPT